MAQTGSSTSGSDDASIYGPTFKDEFHSRIRFNHPGQLAMVSWVFVKFYILCGNENVYFLYFAYDTCNLQLWKCLCMETETTLLYRLLIQTRRTPTAHSSSSLLELASGSTASTQYLVGLRCFRQNMPDTLWSIILLLLSIGKVTGDTIFNALKFNQVETDSNDRPLELLRILSVKVLANPFPDIVPRKLLTPAEVEKQRLAQEEKETKRRVAKKNFNLMSFGEEAEQAESQADAGNFVIGANRFKTKRKKAEEDPGKAVSDAKEKLDEEKTKETVKHKKRSKKRKKEKKEGKEKKREAKEKKQKKEKEKKPDALEEYKRMLKQAKELSDKRGRSSKELSIEKEADERLMSEYERRRYKFLKLNRANKHKQEDTLKMLEKFKQKLSQTQASAALNPAPSQSSSSQSKPTAAAESEYKGGIGENPMEGDEEQDDPDDDGWMTAKLSFKRHIDDEYKKTSLK